MFDTTMKTEGVSTGTQMKAAYLADIGVMEFVDMPLPAVGEKDLLVRVVDVGVCGSDLSTYRGIHPYKKAPVVLGHEFSGEVVATGSQVADFSIGDRVVAASFAGCGECMYCSQRQEHLCGRKRVLSYEQWQGAFAEYVLLTENMTFRLPDVVDMECGALIEPLTIGLHALRQASNVTGRNIVILGSGNIGLATLVCAKRMGAASVTCIDVGRLKGELSIRCGADRYIDVAEKNHSYTIADFFDSPADIVIVCSGHHAAMDEALAMVNKGGEIIIVSYFDRKIALDMNTLVRNEVSLKFSSVSCSDDFAQVIAWLEEGSIEPKSMITDRFSLAQAGEAMQLMDKNGLSVGKIILKVSSGENNE